MNSRTLLALLLPILLGVIVHLPARGQEGGRGRLEAPWNPTQDEITVEKGDTLWALSERIVGSPYLWPRVWAYNPEITNPHWIYPGDVIRFVPSNVELPRLAELVSGTREMPEEVAPPAREESRQAAVEEIQTTQARRPRPRVLATVFITEKELQESGTLTNSYEDKLMLSTGDRVFITFPNEKEGSVGERFMIYKTATPVVHPKTKKRVGYITQVTGFAALESQEDGVSRARLIQTMQEVERGQLVTPLVRLPVADMTVKPARQKIDGTVTAVETGVESVGGAPNFVFLDIGKNDGLEVGNKLSVFIKGDPLRPERPGLPATVFGTLMAVDVRDSVSTCLVLRSHQEIRPGQTVRTIMQPGG